MIVLSTHLDDGVFSCYEMLRQGDATLITVCAGIPAEDVPPSPFDSRGRFRSGADAVRARRAEDHTAAELVGCEVRHLDCLDRCYSHTEDIAGAVTEALFDVGDDEPVFGPLGVYHPDHRAVARQFRAVALERGLNAWLYEDQPYAKLHPDEAKAAAVGCRTPSVKMRPSPGKEAAVRAYRSQIGGWSHMAEILGEETYHRL